MGNLRLAIGAGHGVNSPGKRFPKLLDPNETREWTVNDRIVRYVIEGLNLYDGVSIIRTDDPSGEIDVPLSERARKANDFNADIYISNHHNAGINGGIGGGIVVYIHSSLSDTSTTADYQRKMYEELIAATELKGNRVSPLAKADFIILRLTRMAALLIENGFMDSRVDAPIILSDEFARQSANAQVQFLVKEFNLSRKEDPEDLLPENQYYRVVAGSFKSRRNAIKQQDRLKNAGFESFLSIYEKK